MDTGALGNRQGAGRGREKLTFSKGFAGPYWGRVNHRLGNYA
jgi:uncharacterized protein YcfJ